MSVTIISRFFLVSLMVTTPPNSVMMARPFGLTGLEKLLDTGKTLCDIAAGHAAGMEGTHGQLGTGLTDGLCGDDTDSLAHLYRLAGSHVGAVALGAHTDVGLTGEDGTDLHGIASGLLQAPS